MPSRWVVILPFFAVLCMASEPDLELWPGPARTGAMRAYILGVSNTFSSLPSTTSANVLGIDYDFREGDIIEVSDDSTTTFYVLSVLYSTRRWVQIFDANTAGQVLQATRETFLVSKGSWTHMFPPGKRLSSETPVDLTIGGAPYQRAWEDYTILPGATPGADGGIRVTLDEGIWDAGTVAEMIYSLETAYASFPEFDVGGLDLDFVARAWATRPETYIMLRQMWHKHPYQGPYIASRLDHLDHGVSSWVSDHRVVSASFDGENALVAQWQPSDYVIRFMYSQSINSGRVYAAVYAPDREKLLTGGSASYTFPHYAEDSEDLWVAVRRESDGAYVIPKIEVDTGNITVQFIAPVTSGAYRVIWKEGLGSNGYRF